MAEPFTSLSKLPVQLRIATPEDIADMQRIETSAAGLFKDSPYPELAEFGPISSLTYGLAFAQQDVLLIAEALDETDAFVAAGFAFASPLADGLHLNELSVDRAFQKRGIGAMLLQAIVGIAQDQNHRFVSLTTYQDIAWNAPFYARHGFSILQDEALPNCLQAILNKEILNGANEATRCVMQRILD